MGCLSECLEKLKKKQSDENKNFKDVKEKLNDSLKNISETIKEILMIGIHYLIQKKK